jgi:hypothetical protein
MSIAIRLAVFGKWTENHGYDQDESLEVINSMKKKNFLYYDENPNDPIDSDQDEPSTFTAIQDIDYIKYLHEDCPYEYEIGVISFSYVFNDRLFGIKHFGIEKFQNKWRYYYKRKIQHYSHPRNIQHREIYGKFQ